MTECCVITYENLTREGFEHYMIIVLGPSLTAYPGPNSVVVCDNCTCHMSDKIIRFLTSRGVRLIFLSPYSPDFNPIELVFGWLVQEMRLYLGPSTLDLKFVFLYLLSSVSAETMRGFFGRAGLVARSLHGDNEAAARSFLAAGAFVVMWRDHMRRLGITHATAATRSEEFRSCLAGRTCCGGPLKPWPCRMTW